MNRLNARLQGGWIKVIVFLIIAAGVVFVLMNFGYFAKQLGFYFDRTFVTDQQRELKQDDHAITYEPNMLYIPSLEITAPIQFVQEQNETVFQEALQHGVVQYPGTAKVGDVGNTYIFGHSSDFAFSKGDYKTVFALLPNIDLGTEIAVTNDQGRVFKYKVFDKFVAKKTDVHLLEQNTNGRTILTLQTSYPIGTALQRYIVKAEYVGE